MATNGRRLEAADGGRRTTADPEPYRPLSAKGVGGALGVSVRQVGRLLSAGWLPEPVRVGRCVRWRATDLAAWVHGGCKKSEKSTRRAIYCTVYPLQYECP